MPRITCILMVALTLAACGDDDAECPTPDDVDASPSEPDATEPTVDAAVPTVDADQLPDAEPPPPVALRILAFNDFHGNLEPPAGSGGTVITEMPVGLPVVTVPAGGAAFFADTIAALRAESAHSVVVSAGDLVGGSPLLSALFHDEPTIEAMNLVGLDIAAVGNHEFDEGTAELLRMQFGGCHSEDGCLDDTPFGGAEFTYLAANVTVDEAATRTLFPRYVVREYEGVPVAFIGMTLEGTPGIVTPLGVGGLGFADEAATVNALVPELQAQGIEAIVVLLHEGGFQTGLYDECVGVSGAIVDIATALDSAVDVVVSGHTHAAYNCEIAGKRVTSALSFGRLVTRIDLVLDPVTRDVVSIDAENEIVRREGEGVTAILDLLTHYLAIAAPLRDRVIGSTTAVLLGPRAVGGATPAGESALGDVIADAQLAATAAPITGSAVMAFMNPGGIRADLDAGPVTFGEAFAVQPFSNSMVVLTLTGAQIDTLLEQQFTATTTRILQVSAGFRYTWSASAPVGQKVDPASIQLGGVTIDPAASYRVAVNNFLSTGGDGFAVLKDGTDRLGGAVDLEALEDYLVVASPISPPTLDRITVLP